MCPFHKGLRIQSVRNVLGGSGSSHPLSPTGGHCVPEKPSSPRHPALLCTPSRPLLVSAPCGLEGAPNTGLQVDLAPPVSCTTPLLAVGSRTEW